MSQSSTIFLYVLASLLYSKCILDEGTFSYQTQGGTVSLYTVSSRLKEATWQNGSSLLLRWPHKSRERLKTARARTDHLKLPICIRNMWQNMPLPRMLGLWDDAQLALCYQTWKLWHNIDFMFGKLQKPLCFPFLLAFWRVAFCRQMNLPNCIAFSYPIFLRAFSCTGNISKGTASLQTSSLHSSNYGNSAMNMQNNHIGPSTRSHNLGELCLMCFKTRKSGELLSTSSLGSSDLFCPCWKRNTALAKRSTSGWDDSFSCKTVLGITMLPKS